MEDLEDCHTVGVQVDARRYWMMVCAEFGRATNILLSNSTIEQPGVSERNFVLCANSCLCQEAGYWLATDQLHSKFDAERLLAHRENETCS